MLSDIEKATKTKPDVNDSNSSTIIYSWASTPVPLVNDPMDQYKKVKYILPSSLKSPKACDKAKFNIRLHGIKKRKPKYWFRCIVPNCKHTFPAIKFWNTHHEAEHRSFQLRCCICKKCFNMPSAKCTHSNLHASHKYCCYKCGKAFPYASALQQYTHVHALSSKHKCFAGGCNRSYKWPQDLNCHIRTHTNPTKYICSESKKEFWEERLLKWHAAKHSNIHKYICPKCGIKMKWPTPYRQHVLRCIS